MNQHQLLNYNEEFDEIWTIFEEIMMNEHQL